MCRPAPEDHAFTLRMHATGQVSLIWHVGPQPSRQVRLSIAKPRNARAGDASDRVRRETASAGRACRDTMCDGVCFLGFRPGPSNVAPLARAAAAFGATRSEPSGSQAQIPAWMSGCGSVPRETPTRSRMAVMSIVSPSVAETGWGLRR